MRKVHLALALLTVTAVALRPRPRSERVPRRHRSAREGGPDGPPPAFPYFQAGYLAVRQSSKEGFSMRKFHLAFALLVVAALALGAAQTGDARPAAAKASAAAVATPYKVALVTDIGGLDDRSFNFLANKGLAEAKRKLGVQTRVFISRSNADYVPNLSTAARQGYNLVIAVGFLMADAVKTVSKSFPNTKFAIVDSNVDDMKPRPKNVLGLLFKEQEAGYMAGYIAALAAKNRKNSAGLIAAVGGMKIPPVDRFIAGYYVGAKKAWPQVKVTHAYSQDFVDQAKCKEAALNFISQGATVIFQVAGACGLGALSAAKEKALWGIGVDADQGYLGAYVLTSAVKRVDVAVYSTIAAGVKQGDKLRAGYNAIFTVKNGGVGYGKISARAQPSWKKALESVRKQIASGQIKVLAQTPPST
jgi:basic membrane protein A